MRLYAGRDGQRAPPGMYETQVAQWGYAIAWELGVEQLGFDVMVASGDSNRTLIGKAINRRIQEGDYVMLESDPNGMD